MRDDSKLRHDAGEVERGEETMKYWAYRHINGSIHVKSYRDGLLNARASIDDAFESDFVDDVLDPFEAESRQEAEQIAKARLDSLKEATI